jgi:inorganic pyrophosphatase
MPNFLNLPPFTEDSDVHVVVETPRGSRAKFAYDPKLETFILSKSLLTGLTYPHDWGFVPSTKADDGDPLDIMVIHDAATFPGIVLTCRVIGILEKFFIATDELEDKTLEIIGWKGPKIATKAIKDGAKNFSRDDK